ncbi:hypothetical protein J3U01_08590 [Bifidobacterium sp. B4107]|uniref:hypothetical protein n=1 Tax=unclassified Bifidobacterium TaxID=2608897 RepID=UPI00226B2741|nr:MULTISPECIES: hypothetical protein [unclassified Bifidobacterium]MCX8648456.1 hypothetical protein [Bifidobacterium sp. B4107]MCX8652552.1 hypothetical protein [Bifidobacterium sp. B4111]MCX8659084.1 hypothetical protein [Bifidobacterium sp. B4114]
MSDLLTTLLETVIPMLLTGIGGVCGWLLKSHRKEEAKDQAMEAGLRTLLRAELLEIHTRHVIHHEPISVSIQDEADRVYRAYHGLGGNGTGTMMHEQIMRLDAYADRDDDMR